MADSPTPIDRSRVPCPECGVEFARRGLAPLTPVLDETARAAKVAVWVVTTGSDDLATLAGGHPECILAGFDELQSLLQGFSV